MKGFLYGQTEYNMLQNVNRIDEYIKLAKENHFDFLSITDENLYGHYKFYKKCLEAGIQPIIGLEFKYKTEDQNYSKALLYAKNNEGYKALLKISSQVKTKELEDLEFIKEYAKNLNIIFVFNESFMERLILSDDSAFLEEYCQKIKEYPHVFIGISFTNRLDKLDLNKKMQNYAISQGLKTIPIHQCRYLKREQAHIYEAITAIGNHKYSLNEYEDYSFEESPAESRTLDEFVAETHLELFKEKIDLPIYPNTKEVSSREYLKALCYKGVVKRGCQGEAYYSRLEYELKIIDKMGYNDYFLIVWDFIKYAKQNRILVGPGRGSAAGSLVSYTLGITEVDPLKYDLLFERFLNPERISMPDIDTDFPDVDRDRIIDYVKKMYGDMHVCNISAYGTFLEKSAIRDYARVCKMDSSRVEKIIEMVSQYGFDTLLEEYKNSDLYDFLYIAQGLVGLPRHISTHAAGIILSQAPLDEIIPLQEGINGLYQSQLEAQDLEKIGLLKMDFLGIRNLTMISSMMQEIPNFDMKKLRGIPLNDKKVYEMLSRADTLGIFQLESTGIRNVLSKLQPTCFEDLVAVLALYRPGPMDNIDEFIRRKHQGTFEYIHPSLEPILSSTYGIIVYQEQIMKIAQTFAGYSLGEADILRRAVSKKDSNMLKDLEKDFVERSNKKGYSLEIAKGIYDLIFKFANYGFNRSHSVAYALLSYQMAYFKANYFPIFMANILNNVIGNTVTLSSYIQYAREKGLITLKPNVNVSKNIFVSTNYGLFIPLNCIFSIGEIAARNIVEEREKNGHFKNFNDFKTRCTFLSSQNIQALIFSGALDIFGRTKKSMNNVSSKEDEVFLRHMEGIIEDTSEYEISYLKEMELKYLGMNIEYNVFKDIHKLSAKYKTISIKNAEINQQGRFLVVFQNLKEITTKKNEKMLVGVLKDSESQKRFVIFPKVYIALEAKIVKDQLYLILGILEKDNKNEDTIQILKIALISL